MGSNSSKGKKYQDASKYGQLYFQTDKTAYHAGEMVTGTIYLNLTSPYPGNQLLFKLKGKESAHMVRSESRDSKTHEVGYDEENEIINKTIPVFAWNDSLPPGQFNIPFSFLLPHDLPASFYQQGNRYFCVIEYKLEAFLQPYKKEDPKLKYKQPLNLRETISSPKTGDLFTTVTTNLKTCCCCKQGSNVLKASFEKNYYTAGEQAKVSMELDNSGSSLKNQKVQFSLRQRLEVRAGGQEMVFDSVKVRQELPGIPKGSKKTAGSLDIVLPRFPTESDFKREVNPNKLGWFTLLGFKDNNDVITSSTKSSLITSEFYLEVSCPMSGCCATKPRAQCTIGMYAPEFQLPVVTAPQNWQPVMMDCITLVFPAQQTQPFVQPNGPMVGGQMIQAPMSQPQQQYNVQMSQNPQYTGYNQNYPPTSNTGYPPNYN